MAEQVPEQGPTLQERFQASRTTGPASPRERGRELPVYVTRRRRHPGEVVTRSASIRNFCRECLGWDAAGCGSLAAAVAECSARECWLWPWRNGAIEVDDVVE